MDSKPHDVEKQASAIAHAFFWSVAGRHQACVEQLQDISGAVPNGVWLSLCFEPLLFGLSFFGEHAGKRYTAPDCELFMAELETAIRWLLATIIFQPDDVGCAASQMRQLTEIANATRRRWVLTKGHERALAPFLRWCEVRRRQSQTQTDTRPDAGRLFEELKTDLARDGYHCPESVLRVFAQGVVAEACRIRADAIRTVVLDDRSSARHWQQADAGPHSRGPTRARTG